jgi:hypothetical protein
MQNRGVFLIREFNRSIFSAIDHFEFHILEGTYVAYFASHRKL